MTKRDKKRNTAKREKREFIDGERYVVSATVDAETKRQFVALADEQDRSEAWLVLHLVEQYIASQNASNSRVTKSKN